MQEKKGPVWIPPKLPATKRIPSGPPVPPQPGTGQGGGGPFNRGYEVPKPPPHGGGKKK